MQIPFFKQIKLFSIIFNFIGFLTFTIDKQNQCIVTTGCNFLYSLGLAIVLIISLTYYSILTINDGGLPTLSGVNKISDFANIIIVAITFDIIIGINLIYRKRHIKFLNKFNAANKKLVEILDSSDTPNIKINFPILFFILISIFIFSITGVVMWTPCQSISTYLFSILNAFANFSLILWIIYIKFLANILAQKLTILNGLFKKSFKFDDNSNKKNCNSLRLFKLIEIMENFNKVKRSFEKVFGCHLFLSLIMDSLIITTTIFATINLYRSTFRLVEIYYMCVFIGPHLYKIIGIALALELLGMKVSN